MPLGKRHLLCAAAGRARQSGSLRPHALRVRRPENGPFGGSRIREQDRPDAPARRFKDKVPATEKNRRLKELFAFQEAITRQKQAAMVGKTLEVLVEGESKRQQKRQECDRQAGFELTGRTSGNRIVNFFCNTDCDLDIRDFKGQIINIKVENAFSNSLWGIPAETASTAPQNKGGYVYVA